MCLSEDENKELPENSTDIFKRNMVDRYIDRPNSTFTKAKYRDLNKFCFSEITR